MISELFAKYQFGAIHTTDITGDKNYLFIVIIIFFFSIVRILSASEWILSRFTALYKYTYYYYYKITNRPCMFPNLRYSAV